ncbi:hypothetical protein R5R35_007682 [Gryllus longicercus]|uniref:Uncharacterized protein n=1 Tax=Gryllus longicercus TaxID=2509291 RepID=A0AAN9VC12_9ORTH
MVPGELAKLYYTPLGAPCRAVLLAARALKINLNLSPLDMHHKKEHLEEWYAKINPQRITPTLVDSKYVLWESRAINKYLALKQRDTEHRDISHQLWPSDLRQQSRVDRLLYFDMGTLYQSMTEYFKPMLTSAKNPEQDKILALENSLRLLNLFLQDSKYAAGDHLTLADISLVTSISQLEPYGYKMDASKYNEVESWRERVVSAMPFYEEVSRDALRASAAWAAYKLKLIEKKKNPTDS